MPTAVQNVLNTITEIITAFKKFFEDIIAMFQTKEEGDDANA